MSRLQPYRSRIPTHIIKLLDVSSRITLFLVGQNGPLSFIFKDRLENKYKTLIGSEIKCSCSPNKNDHCIHSLYVLLKIFKISVQNPIIWQASYIDSQLQDIISGKHTILPVRHRIARPNFLIQNDTEILPSDFYLKKQITRKQTNFIEKVKPLDLEEDSVCPICQENMTKSMCLTHCKVGCGNNYHLQCLKVWINHKKNEESKITCPMCRQQFNPSIFQQIKNQETEWKKKQMIKKSHKYKCNSCGIEQIPKNVHKCILCQKFSLCDACYIGKKHIKHPFIRRNEAGQWQAAQQRRSGELKVKQFIDSKRKQSKNKQILQKLRQSKKLSLLDFICSAYPYVSKYISDNIDPYRKLNLEPETMQCFKCGSKRMIFLRRLPCGHFIDHECLKQNIRKGITYCQKDGDKLVKGYEQMLEQEKEIKYEQEKIQLQVDNEFGDVNLLKNQTQEEPISRETQQESRENQNKIVRNKREVFREQREDRHTFASNQSYRIRPNNRITNNSNHNTINRAPNNSNNNQHGTSSSISKSKLNFNLLFNSNLSTQHHIVVRQPETLQNRQKYSSSIRPMLQSPLTVINSRNSTKIPRNSHIINTVFPNLQQPKYNRKTGFFNSNHPFFAS